MICWNKRVEIYEWHWAVVDVRGRRLKIQTVPFLPSRFPVNWDLVTGTMIHEGSEIKWVIGSAHFIFKTVFKECLVGVEPSFFRLDHVHLCNWWTVLVTRHSDKITMNKDTLSVWYLTLVSSHQGQFTLSSSHWLKLYFLVIKSVFWRRKCQNHWYRFKVIVRGTKLWTCWVETVSSLSVSSVQLFYIYFVVWLFCYVSLKSQWKFLCCKRNVSEAEKPLIMYLSWTENGFELYMARYHKERFLSPSWSMPDSFADFPQRNVSYKSKLLGERRVCKILFLLH